MAGKKGKSGGRRPNTGGTRLGAGPPIVRFTIRRGERFYAPGWGMVEAIRMDRKHLVLKINDDEIVLVR